MHHMIRSRGNESKCDGNAFELQVLLIVHPIYVEYRYDETKFDE